MKVYRFLLTLMLFTFLLSLQAQTRSIQRIDLNQKGNLYLKQVAEALWEANCAGKIWAYHPYQPDVKIEVSTFSNYFAIELPKLEVINGYFIASCCDVSFCDLSGNDWTRFSKFLEVVEDEFTSPNGKSRKVVYVRLLFEGSQGIEKGPLFHFDEIMNAQISIINPENHQKYTLAQVFDLHLYQDYRVSENGEVLDSDESLYKKETLYPAESDMWDY